MNLTSAILSRDTFPARFPNISVDKLWKNWNEAPLLLWQSQLNFGVWCASSACGVSPEHLNYAKHSTVRAVYRFHVYYHVGRVLKRLQVPLSHEASSNAADNPYTKEEFFKICEDYKVPNYPMRYRDKNSIGLISMVLSGQMTT